MCTPMILLWRFWLTHCAYQSRSLSQTQHSHLRPGWLPQKKMPKSLTDGLMPIELRSSRIESVLANGILRGLVA